MKEPAFKSFRGNAAGLEHAMRQGRIVKFKYRKLYGSTRHATGRILKAHQDDMGLEAGVFRYWDMAAGDWRSFHVRNLL